MIPQERSLEENTIEMVDQQTMGLGKRGSESGVKELIFYKNQRVTVLKQIAHFRFTTLTILSLGGNEIQSIEGFSLVFMPSIQSLYLQDNRVISAGAIGKAVWPALLRFRINNNHIGEMNPLTKGFFPQIEILYVHNQWGGENNQFIDHCFPSKLQAPLLKHLRLRGSKFCFHRSARKVLQREFEYVLIQ